MHFKVFICLDLHCTEFSSDISIFVGFEENNCTIDFSNFSTLERMYIVNFRNPKFFFRFVVPPFGIIYIWWVEYPKDTRME